MAIVAIKNKTTRLVVKITFEKSASVRGETFYRLLKSSFFFVQSMGGALLLERFWCAISFTCCRDMLSAGMVSVTKPWEEEKHRR